MTGTQPTPIHCRVLAEPEGVVAQGIRELASVLGITLGALARDRYQGFGRRVRYLQADVAHYLTTRRTGGDGTA